MDLQAHASEFLDAHLAMLDAFESAVLETLPDYARHVIQGHIDREEDDAPVMLLLLANALEARDAIQTYRVNCARTYLDAAVARAAQACLHELSGNVVSFGRRR
jgi:hypothetical protein